MMLTIVKQGNMIYVSPDGLAPTPDAIFSLLYDHLSYDHREFRFGWKARNPVTGLKQRVKVTHRLLHGKDNRGRLFTNLGFLRKIHGIFKQHGIHTRYVDLDQHHEAKHGHPRPLRYTPVMDNVLRCFKFRQRQDECLKAIAMSPHGLVHAVTGFGKMVMIAMVCLLYPKAKIHIVTKRVPLVNKMVEFLTRYIPNVGQFGAGRKVMGDRITVFTTKSLSYSDYDADFLLADEGHEVITEECCPVLARYQRSRNFTFTATPVGRTDGSDPRLEAFFGPTIFYLPYWEAVELGLVVPIRVEWEDVILDSNPAADCSDIDRKRHGIWFNDPRNDIIAKSMVRVPNDEQKLVLTDTIFHAVELYKRVRDKGDYTVVYDTIDINRFKDYQALSVLPADLERMTPERKEKHRRRFEAGEGHYISTPTWEVGIDPVHCRHIFIASSFSSEIKAQQAPGRGSRISEGKEIGIIHDCRDQFDPGFRAAARERYRIFASLRWEQVVRRDNELIPLS